jgi:GNAT superfamily N-acetyltransferase
LAPFVIMSQRMRWAMEPKGTLCYLNSPENTVYDKAECLSWLYDAGNPYWEWLWGSADEALSQLKTWLNRSNSEISNDRVLCVLDSTKIYGGFVALGGRELQQCRKADFLTLFNYARYNHYEKLLSRMRIANQFFGAVSDDEYYLSRIGLLPDRRGTGLGRQLVRAYMDNGLRSGYRRFRLDVAESNIQAIKLYETSGFVINRVSEVLDVPFQYCSMTAVS